MQVGKGQKEEEEVQDPYIVVFIIIYELKL